MSIWKALLALALVVPLLAPAASAATACVFVKPPGASLREETCYMGDPCLWVLGDAIASVSITACTPHQDYVRVCATELVHVSPGPDAAVCVFCIDWHEYPDKEHCTRV